MQPTAVDSTLWLQTAAGNLHVDPAEWSSIMSGSAVYTTEQWRPCYLQDDCHQPYH